MDASNVTAVLALVLAIASLSWQWWVHRTSGVRVEIGFVLILTEPNISVDLPITVDLPTSGLSGPILPRFENPRLGVEVRNTGRLPTTMVGGSIGTDAAQTLLESAEGFPAKIDISDRRLFIISPEGLHELLEANRTAKKPSRDMTGTVRLGNGETVSRRFPVAAIEATFPD